MRDDPRYDGVGPLLIPLAALVAALVVLFFSINGSVDEIVEALEEPAVATAPAPGGTTEREITEMCERMENCRP